VVEGLTLAHGEFVVQRDLSFTVGSGEIFVIMGGSGCGKTTLLRHMIGLQQPMRGDVLYNARSFWGADEETRAVMQQRFGVLYQGGALLTALTLGENVALPLAEFTDLTTAEIGDIVALKLALVGLAGFEEFYPAELSGGMTKRAGLARAMALDPDILFLDEPSAGLDPVTSSRLDDLILELRDSLGCTFVVVSHELASIFTIADTAAFLDRDARTMTALGNPRRLLAESPDAAVRAFLTRRAPSGRAVASGAPQTGGPGRTT
jgi:phospholipid/cholesterol/gamma-HCH transport system ATP-binding protein